MDRGVASKAEISSAEDVQITQDSVPVSNPAVPEKCPYPLVAVQPMQRVSQGIFCDFNEVAGAGLRPRAEGKKRVRLRGLDTGDGLFEVRNKGGFVINGKAHYIRFSIEVRDSEADTQVLTHEYDACGQDILRPPLRRVRQ